MRKYILIIIVLSAGMLFDTTGFAVTKKNVITLPRRRKQIQPSFAIYAAKIKGRDLSKAKLIEPPLLTVKDIITYEWTNHSMKITPEATVRLAKTLKPNVRGVPFVVVVKGKRCYKGAFWWSISSCGTFETVILADNLLKSKSGATLRFQDGYPAGFRWKASGRIYSEKEKIPAYENKSVRDILMRMRKLTKNGLIITSGGYRYPFRPGEYRTRMTNEDQAKSNAAYKKIYHRYGREDYKLLRDDLLWREHAFTSPGEFVATVRIFHEAYDKESLIKALSKLNPKVIRDSYTWSRIDEIIAWDGMKVYQAFIMTCQPKIYRPCHFNFFQNKYLELLTSGKANKAERAAVEKMINMEPKLFARFCKPLNRDERLWMNAINAELANNTRPAINRRKNIDRMMSFVLYYTSFDKFKLSDYPELKKFVSLLDCNDEQEVYDYIRAAGKLKIYNKVADLLIQRIELPISSYEENMLAASSQMFMNKKTTRQLIIEKRRGQLIDFLLKAKRAKEAQIWAEKFYGANADPNKIRFMSWERVGRTQMLSGARVFENKLKKAEHKAGTWAFYRQKYQYYLGRKDAKKALKTLHEAIEKGKKLQNHELVVFASCRLSSHYGRKGERKKALEIARKNNAYAVENMGDGKKIMRKAGRSNGTQARMEAASQLMNILEEMKISGWESEWERVARREFLDGQTFLLRHFLYKKRRMNKNYTMSSNDEIFKKLCSEAYQKEHYFCYQAHELRLAAVPYTSWFGDGFESCLKQALKDFEKYKRPNEKAPWMLHNITFYDAPHKAERKALLAKYLFDNYPKAFRYKLVASLPARDYGEGKALLGKYWNSGEIEPLARRKALTTLLKKAPNQTEKRWCKKELAKLGKSKK